MALYDLSALLTTEASVQQACETFKTWCLEQGLDITRDDEEFQHDFYKKRSLDTALQEALPCHLMWLVEHCGTAYLDRWWIQQGKTCYWDEEAGRPRPELGHLLVHAAHRGSCEGVEWALQHGWSPDVCDASKEKAVPLHLWLENPSVCNLGIDQYYERLFEQLLTPFTVNSQNSEGRTPVSLLLHKQSLWRYENERTVKIGRDLVAAGADVNRADIKGLTPLHYYVSGFPSTTEEHALNMLDFLLEAGADPRTRTLREPFQTPLELLYEGLQSQGLEFALRGTTAVTRIIMTRLEQAIRQHDARDLEACLQEKVVPERGGGRTLSSTSRMRV